MRKSHLYTSSLLLIAASFAGSLMISCSGSASSDAEPMKLYSDSASMPQAEALTGKLSPSLAAQSVISWLMQASQNDGTFARRISRDIMYCYISTGRGDDAEAFSIALDSIKNTLSVEQQAHLFAVSAAPMQLGRMLAADPERDALVPLIEREYSSDSLSLAAFREGLNSESDIH